jgi:hypothetical protein
MDKVAHINHVMKTINSYTDDIYESLMDGDTEDLNRKIFLLIAVLKEVQQTLKDEI